jgi:hypothetical protein
VDLFSNNNSCNFIRGQNLLIKEQRSYEISVCMGTMGVSKYSLKYSRQVDGALDDLETYLPMLPSIK